MIKHDIEAVFPLGQIVATPKALETISPDAIIIALMRHSRGDWGGVDFIDRDLNDNALVNGDRVLSVYGEDSESRFWIITEADRSVTTILLPFE